MSEEDLEPLDFDDEDLDSFEAIEESGSCGDTGLLEEFEEDDGECVALGEAFKPPPWLTASYEKNPEPIAIVDGSISLTYLYENPPFRKFLERYRLGAHRSLIASIWNQVDKSVIEALRQATHDLDSGFSWQGEISIKSRDTLTALIKLHLYPFIEESGSQGEPRAFWIHLEDITDERQQLQRDYIDALLKASLQKDNDTGKHVTRVNRYSQRLAEALYHDGRWPRVDRDFIEDIGYLAAMHDVGKIGISEAILYKPGPLNEQEWKEMREHPIIGALILSSYPVKMAQEIAKSHHEKWNGSGYPYNLSETNIPLSARIVTIADVYDALRMRRSYKPSLEHGVSVSRIAEDAGSHFDPDLVGVFVAIAEDFRRIFDSNED
ncbi:MAG: HD-GYP domain-containing protein [Spirochaetota bacterium]